ncbi:MAG: hypothetical protein R2909_09170 [Gemmatimonadales bacterium]
MRIVRALVVAALLHWPAPTHAQSGSPEETARPFLDAVATRRWDQAARLLDQRAFEEVLDDFVSRAGRSDDRRLPTVEDLRRQDPSMPRDVAEWQIRQMREAEQRYADPTPFEFAGVRTVAELRRLSPREAAARWLEARDPRYAIRQQLEAMRCPTTSMEQIPVPDRRVLGAVLDGEGVAYAVYRENVEFGGGPSAGGDIGVIELHRDRGAWVVIPRGDLLPELSLDLQPGECPNGR